MVLAFFISSYFTILYTKPATEKPKSGKIYKLTDDEKKQLKTGDIILRKGEGFVSAVINDLFKTGYRLSHCAFVINENDSLRVIHTVSSELSNIDGVQTEPIDKFIRESVDSTVIVVRFKTTNEYQNKFGELAKAYLNKNITFDHKFDIADTTQFYCSELIHRVFLHTYGKDMFTERFESDHPKFLGINAFLDTSKFEIIINHQANYKEPAP